MACFLRIADPSRLRGDFFSKAVTTEFERVGSQGWDMWGPTLRTFIPRIPVAQITIERLTMGREELRHPPTPHSLISL